jgi:hypothetical protein
MKKWISKGVKCEINRKKEERQKKKSKIER